MVSLEEIKDNEFNLSISRYVYTYDDELEIDLENIWNNIRHLEEKKFVLRKEMEHFLREHILKDQE